MDDIYITLEDGSRWSLEAAIASRRLMLETNGEAVDVVAFDRKGKIEIGHMVQLLKGFETEGTFVPMGTIGMVKSFSYGNPDVQFSVDIIFKGKKIAFLTANVNPDHLEIIRRYAE